MQAGERDATNRNLLIGVIILAASGAIVGALLGGTDLGAWRWVHFVCKPLATLGILILAWYAFEPISARYQRWIMAGLLACLLGDALLMLPLNLFVAGLASFAVAQVCFIVAFVSDARFAAWPWPWLLCVVYAALAAWLLWPTLASSLRLPVLVYMLLLATMGGQAIARAWRFSARRNPLAHSARRAAAGAVLFMASDSLLAWDRFRHALPLAALWILATYYAAIGLIALSVHKSSTTAAT